MQFHPNHMKSVLAYFPMRIGSSGLFSVLLNQNFDFSTASSIASFVCFATYVCYIFFNGRRWYGEHKHGYWEDLCPVSVRNRLPNILLNKDDKHRKNPYLKPIGIGEIYMFALIPVFQNIPSFILAKALFKSAGSVFLVHIINKTLVIGWSYRLFERWGLDGCRHILFCDEKIKSAKKDGSSLQSFWVMLAAILSPTATLHFLTGITLL